ncbi:bifunctional hydroxymethylpyrimidine kinase/phosphomethylpyrimidine kinase [Vibrio ostreicida]|uniref:bifunctional hydroxymethylpyrimidine kinase/phosphomethylpyrimidine kinase n=1 Tax=Vibrio ostreicida TaxID=526588 RepID=UPI003B5A943F
MKASPQATPIVLTIAGSDSSGGAGIQADIKTISATGSYACSVITAVTSQNTQGVAAIHPIPLAHIESQLDAVFADLNVSVIKVGMMADSSVIQLVADKIQCYKPDYLVVDPVMIATSGAVLLEESAVTTLKQSLLPLADLITPNLAECAALVNAPIPVGEDDMGALIEELRQLGSEAVLLKGGHLPQCQGSNDLLIMPQSSELLRAKRILTRNTHGTGCTLSSAIASYLAQGNRLHKAVYLGKQYISQAISHADELAVGDGHGPVNHFFAGHSQVR